MACRRRRRRHRRRRRSFGGRRWGRVGADLTARLRQQSQRTLFRIHLQIV